MRANMARLCVSNNVRNPRLDEDIAVRLTTTRRPRLLTCVERAPLIVLGIDPARLAP